MDSATLITPAGHRRLLDELNHLQRVERPKVVTEVADAAAQGDRSENAEYIYGKRRLREIDRRMRFLTHRLRAVRIIDPAQQKGGKVLFGASVTLENEDGKRVVYQLVGEDESEPAQGRISWRSPLGRAMMGKEAGDSVVFRRPDGKQTEYELVSFEYK
jgi:transcription elongation factor GreB